MNHPCGMVWNNTRCKTGLSPWGSSGRCYHMFFNVLWIINYQIIIGILKIEYRLGRVGWGHLLLGIRHCIEPSYTKGDLSMWITAAAISSLPFSDVGALPTYLVRELLHKVQKLTGICWLVYAVQTDKPNLNVSCLSDPYRSDLFFLLLLLLSLL